MDPGGLTACSYRRERGGVLVGNWYEERAAESASDRKSVV